MSLQVVSLRGTKAHLLVIWSSLIFCLLWAPCGVQGALTSGEIAALDQLYSNFPSLALAHRRYDPSTTKEYFGKAWTRNFTSYCDHGEGYEFNGVYCHEGHISGLNLNKQWGLQVSTNYSLIIGLGYLKNITHAPLQSTELFHEVLQSLPVQRITSGTEALNHTAFAYPESVLSLEGWFSKETFNISSFTNLEDLWFTSSTPVSFDTWQWPYATLQSLKIHVPIEWWLDHYHLFTALRVLRVSWSTGTEGTLTPITAVIESQTLQVLDIHLEDTATPVLLTINCSKCLEVNLYWPFSNVSMTAPLIQKLALDTSTDTSWPLLSTSLPYLTELSVRSVGRFDPPDAFPSLDFAPSLISFDWDQGFTDAANWHRILCSLPPTLRSLSLSLVRMHEDLQFPSCLNSLQSLTLSETLGSGIGYNATTLFRNLPTTLTSLTTISAFREPATLDMLKKFPLLKTIQLLMGGWVGNMTADFFENFPRLSTFSGRFFGGVTGTIPSTGWNSLETFELVSSTTSWEGIDSAPNLKRLYIVSPLTRLPSNQQFIAANLQSLVYLEMKTGDNVTVPTFWSELPKIEEVHLSNNLFTGPFDAPISSASLIMVDLSANQICGSLPEITAPIKPDILKFHDNQFSGSIPDSWADNLSFISQLTLHGNPINGTIPDGLFEKNTALPTLSNTELVGPIWNMSYYTPALIEIVNSGINICLVDPEIPEGIQPLCVFNNLPACPSDCPSYWPCRNSSAPCNQSTFIPQTIRECIAPQLDLATPSASLQCPLPPPTGFSCIDGQYVSNGSVTLVVVTIPSGAGIIVVKGNLSVGGIMTFSGLGSTIMVDGCVDVVPTEIHIDLTSLDDLDDLPTTTLINQKGSDCANDLSKILVIVDQPKDGCKRSKVSASDSTRSSLVVAFTIDSSRCNVKWIILGSTLGGVLILAIIAFVLLHVFSSSFRDFCKKGCHKK